MNAKIAFAIGGLAASVYARSQYGSEKTMYNGIAIGLGIAALYLAIKRE